MTNFQVYRKTLPFSFIMFLIDLGGLAAVVGCSAAGFFIANSSTNRALIGLAVGFFIGVVIAALISFFITNRFKAGQIAMMTQGVADDKLPDHVVQSGMAEVKGRFAKIAVFFFVTGAIKSIFRQIGRATTSVANAVGGQAAGSVASVIDSGVQTVIAYLCDCCLGWVMYRKNESAAKAACEGAVIFFKHGKTLVRNVGRIFGMGLLSFVLIGGAFFGLIYLVFALVPQMMTTLSQEILELGVRYDFDLPEFVGNPTFLGLVIAGIGGIALWAIIHSVLIRPFVLTGVLRNFMAAGKEHIPTEEDFAVLDSKSPRFAKLHKDI